MVTDNKRLHQEYKSYVHEKSKYVSLNHAEQTPAFYVIGQKYKVGTGIALIKESGGEVFRNLNSSYKGFLSSLLNNYALDQIVAFKWVPTRVMKAEKLIKQKCYPEPCKKSCVQPGCFCIDEECQGVN